MLMRKHHNKLFYGEYTHKTVFKLPWAHRLYPTTDEHLLKFVKGQVPVIRQYNKHPAEMAGFIMANRHNMKFRVQKDRTIFYANFELTLDIITKYWEYLDNMSSVDPLKVNLLKKNTVACKRYPHNDYQYQVYLKNDLHQILDQNNKESFIQFCKTNKKNIKITNKNIIEYISGKSPYCWHGYFFVKDEKFLSALYIIIEKGIDKVQKYIKI